MAKKFFKLPILKTLAAIGFKPHSGQLSIIEKMDKYRFLVAPCGRRFGKSALLAHLALAKLLEPNTKVGVVGPTYNLSSIIFESVLKLIRNTGLETVRLSHKDKLVELENGSILRAMTSSNPDSLVGKAFDLLILDEIALEKDLDEVFNMHLRPTLTDNPNSRAVFISTPRGDNYFKTLYDRGFDDSYQEWVNFTAPTSTNPLISKEDLEEARRSTSQTVFAQEYLALFTVFEGQIYKTVNIEENLINRVNEDFWYIAAIDPGFRHPTGAVIIATDGELYYIIEDYKVAESTTAIHAEWLLEKIDQYDIEEIYIDPAAAQTAQDFASLYDIPTMKADKAINDGINLCTTLFENKELIIDAACIDLIYELGLYAWKGTNNQGKDVVLKENDDVADAMRYAIYTSYTKPMGISAA